MSGDYAAGQAADLLVHYFRMLAQHAGVTWDGDYSSEIRSIVDHLMDAVRDEIRDHAENAPHLYADGSS